MRWEFETKQPTWGTTRCSIKFAWMPVVTKDKKKVWLEDYLLVEKFEAPYTISGSTLTYGKCGEWRAVDMWSQDSTMWHEWNEKLKF